MEKPPIISPDASRIRELEDRLFARGEMLNAPCFVCGYNNTGYFNSARRGTTRCTGTNRTKNETHHTGYVASKPPTPRSQDGGVDSRK